MTQMCAEVMGEQKPYETETHPEKKKKMEKQETERPMLERVGQRISEWVHYEFYTLAL